MLIEVTRLSGALPVADVCVVGSGPAGLALAEALGDTGRSLLVLESGGLLPDGFAQSLNQGSVTGAPYSGLANTRFRQVGGTATVWNTPVNGRAGPSTFRSIRGTSPRHPPHPGAAGPSDSPS